jgi:MFS transporter, ACS family, glucarate transporter
LWTAVRCERAEALVAFAAASCMCAAATQPIWWSCAIGISGRHVGSLFGLMNMAGLLGAAASQSFTGHFAGWRERLGYTGREQWDPIFNVYVVMLIVCAVCWAAYRSREVEPVVENAHDTRATRTDLNHG